ncbi:hypothetical protein LZD49_33435 [Dyadobacter sp. CY261]|uniref:hypothetical protein n=1 Tax=Dyadobacter sp. CY261 TaxID=2907203 RepID=UPI001F384AF0|nr:hypothetical protein [Dyadobacter sp. CY261]MCF0075430.1 hypothetical protein [Dyadobacter sp. CY261]
MDLSRPFINYLIFIFINLGLIGLIAYFGGIWLARVSVKTRIPVIFFVIVFFILAWPLGKYFYETFGYISRKYNYYSFYHRLFEYWAWGIPITLCFGLIGMYTNAEASVKWYLDDQKAKKQIQEAHNDKGWAGDDEIKKSLK